MPYLFNKYYPLRNIFFVVGEGILIFISITVVLLIISSGTDSPAPLPFMLSKVILVTIVFQVCLYYFDMYDFSSIGSFSENATRITQAFGFGCIVLAGAYYFFPSTTISFGAFLISYVAFLLHLYT